MNGSLQELIKWLIICFSIYGAVYLFGMKPSFRGKRRTRRTGTAAFLEEEARSIEQQRSEETKKRDHRRDTISRIARRKPDRIASALRTWLLENNGHRAQ